MFEIAVECISSGNIKVRKRIADLRQLNVAAFSNCERTGKYIRRILEHLIHFIVVLYIEPGALELHPVGILNAFSGLNADHHVLRVGVIFAEIVAVIRRHQWKPDVFLQLKKTRMNPVLHFQSLVLNFQEEILFSENIRIGSCGCSCCIVLVFHQELRHFAFQAS